jgi:hypothetical protein
VYYFQREKPPPCPAPGQPLIIEKRIQSAPFPRQGKHFLKNSIYLK